MMLNHTVVVMVALGGMLLMAGCPKKVSPVGKTPEKLVEQVPPPLNNQKDVRDEETQRETVVTSLREEEIPPTPINETEISSETQSPVNKLEGSPLTDIFFEFGQWTVRPEDVPRLTQSATWLSEHPNVKLSIEGHADKRGTNEYNLVLAEKRAAAVQEYLLQFGIPAARMVVVSFGEERPSCTTEDETCFQQNRRAHFSGE